MVRYTEWTGELGERDYVELNMETPRSGVETGSVLVVVERIDEIDEPFHVEASGLPREPLGAVPNRAQVLVATDTYEEQFLRVRVTAEERGGWFRARVLWLKEKLPSGRCYVCRKALATVVSACFAFVGVPMPDLTIVEIDAEIFEQIRNAIVESPLTPFIAKIHEGLPNLLESAIRGFDLVSTGLNQLYRYCCKQLGLC